MILLGHAFLLLVLPLALAAYWGLLRAPRTRLVFLGLLSYGFYAASDLRFLPLLLALSFLTFRLAQAGHTGTGVAIHLAVLGIFKAGFAAAALPLGLSFYAFKHVGYLLDCRSGVTTPTRDLLAFATHSAFFAQIVAGPIDTFTKAGSTLAELPARLASDQARRGLVFLSLGLAKKVLIADPLALALRSGLYEAAGGGGLLWAWSSLVVFGLQLYFDFAGYTDIALGIAQLFGVPLPANFDRPYLATNPRQFWDRWHMSLSLWFRVYLFLPLSRALLRRFGRERSEVAQHVANLATMTLVGLWHGATGPFLLWGAYHGLLLNLHAWTSRRRWWRAPAAVDHGLLLLAVLVGWALFLSPDLSFATRLLAQLLGMGGLGGGRALEAYAEVLIVIAAA
ncbi:MAG TPA: MBOAT family O-acyltransferase, partial [Vicinamibacteria bacterium]